MTVRLVVGIGLVLAGAALGVQLAIALGIVTTGFELVRRPWRRLGPAAVGYRRRLASDRIPWGESVTLTLEAWNLSRLPISWLRTEDAISEDLVVRERRLLPGELGDLTLRNTWTLGPRELVRRRQHLGARRRGVFAIGPTSVQIGDLFALPASHESIEATDRVIAWPRTVAAPAVARQERMGGAARARHGLIEDPARFAGVRPYRPGDPVRRLHVRTTARLGQPMSKRFEPSRDRDILLAVDLELADGWPETPAATLDSDPGGSGDLARIAEPDPTEDLIVVAASLLRALELGHAAFGVAAAGYAGSRRRIAYLPVTPAPGQLERALDLLARLSGEPSVSFERLAAFLGKAVREGTTVLVLTTRTVDEIVRPLRSLQRLGLTIGILATGPDAEGVAGSGRRAGFTAQVVRLDGTWRTATRVAVA